MLYRLAQLLYLMAPAYLANMAPPFVRYWKGWNRPIHEPTLGSHKTVVGFLAGVATGIAAAGMQAWIGWGGALLDHDRWLLLGFLLGFGALAGDALKSFVKRRRRLPPGTRWVPWDQLDFVLGALLFVAAWADLGVADVAAILAVSFVGDLAVNRVAYWLGIKQAPW
jgi:CDP-2,3-bis-(O-geranylgeranyl)-sn-glycerol synthase